MGRSRQTDLLERGRGRGAGSYDRQGSEELSLTIRRQPASARWVSDLLGVVFFTTILAVDVFVGMHAFGQVRGAIDFVMGSVALLGGHLLVIALLRIVVPIPETGAYLVRLEGGYLRWIASDALAQIALHPLVRGPFWFTHLGRWLYLRALGAELEVDVSIPESFWVRDPALLAIESGAQIEPGVFVEPAIHAAGRLLVERIVIGGGALVGANVTILAGAAIGEDARVGHGAFIGAGSKVGLGAFLGERATLEENVDVGSYAVIGAGALIAVGVAIGERAKVVAGSVVPSGTAVEDREVWEGTLSARVEAFAPPAPPVPLPRDLLLLDEAEAEPVRTPVPRSDTDRIRARKPPSVPGIPAIDRAKPPETPALPLEREAATAPENPSPSEDEAIRAPENPSSPSEKPVEAAEDPSSPSEKPAETVQSPENSPEPAIPPTKTVLDTKEPA